MVSRSMNLDSVRITWLSTRVPTTMRPGGVLPGGAAITGAWSDPGSAPPLPFAWRHPWLDPTAQAVEPDRTHWLEWLGLRAFTGKVDPAFVSGLIKAAVPLLADTPLDAVGPTTTPLASVRAELFLHPWAVSSAVSATLRLPANTGIAAAAAAATAFRAQPVLVARGVGPTVATDPASLAEALADASLALTGAATDPAMRQLPPVVVATVIAGDPGPAAQSRPWRTGAFCDAMHVLAGDNDPGSPLHWIKVQTAGGPGCVETKLVQVLTTGVAQWFSGAMATLPADPAQRTGTLHRRATLRMVVLRSIHAFFERPSLPADPLWLASTAGDLRRLAGIHYGPAKDHRDFLAQAYIDLHGLGALLANPTRQFDARCPDPPAAA